MKNKNRYTLGGCDKCGQLKAIRKFNKFMLCLDCENEEQQLIKKELYINKCINCSKTRITEYPIDEQNNSYCPDCNWTFDNIEQKTNAFIDRFKQKNSAKTSAEFQEWLNK